MIINILVLVIFNLSWAHMDPDRMDDKWEKKLIGKNSSGQLVRVSAAHQDQIAISVHGINASPSALASVMKKRINQNFETYAYAWDAQFRRLNHSANDFKKELKDLIKNRPGVSIMIDAHSMGARMVLVALGRMQRLNELEGHQVTFNMLAPTLSGYKSANSAIGAPTLAQNLVKNLRPSMDMGTKSLFQKELEKVRLTSDVRVQVFYAENDRVAPVDAKSLLISKKLNANLQVVEGTNHSTIIP